MKLLLLLFLFSCKTEPVVPQPDIPYFVYIVSCHRAPQCMTTIHERCGSNFVVVKEDDYENGKYKYHQKIVHCVKEKY